MDANEPANPQLTASEWAKLAALLPPDYVAACEKNAADLFTAGSVAYFDEAIAQGFAWILDPTTGA